MSSLPKRHEVFGTHTLEAIGHELDLTRERVRQLEGQALSRLAALREFQTVAASSASHENVKLTGRRGASVA